MKLQNLLLPKVDFCTEKELYFRSDSVKLDIINSLLIFNNKDIASFDTYFNSFSIEKWKKYTIINNLFLSVKLKGKFRVTIINKKLVGKDVIKNVLTIYEIETEKSKEFEFELPIIDTRGILCFQLESLKDNSIFYGGAYLTKIDESSLPHVCIGIGICTYKREHYVKRLLQTLSDSILNNPESPLYNLLRIYVSDNGKTLPYDELNNEFVNVFPNKNVGGSGGFTRCMIEILKDEEKYNITHILLMDDDILIDTEAIFRTYTFLKLLKEEYRQAFIGGAMLNLDIRYIQMEGATHWDTAKHHPVKYNYDLRDCYWTIKNEIEEPINHTSWCYCCMPINKISPSNLPLPVFIKRDDTEYGLRNGAEFVTLNGICVWHEPFEYKRASYLEYYYIRNACILDAIHRPHYGKKQAKRQLLKFVISRLFLYKYKDIDLYFRGIEDFCKGIDWLKEQDGELLNKEIMDSSYRTVPVDSLPFGFSYGGYEASLRYSEKKFTRFKRLITFNGWLLPANRSVIVPTSNPIKAKCYRARRVLHYECDSNRGYITNKSYKELIRIIKGYFRIRKLINKRYEIAKKEYHDRYWELTNIEFWNKYLEENANLSSEVKKKKTKKPEFKEYVKLGLLYLIRGLQHLLFWVPVKKNRVLLYVHNRKGYTCNPKYIAESLRKYGNKFELYWATSYPETVEHLRELGITPVKFGSFDYYLKYFTSKVLITNDHQRAFLIKRENQFLINTWHASGNYKKIGFAINYDRGLFGTIKFKLQHKGADMVISGCTAFTRDMPYSLGLPKEVFVECGLPRNDIFFKENKELVSNIKSRFGLDEGIKIVLYAPTFRGSGKGNASTNLLDVKRLIRSLHKRFGGEWVCFFRGHYFYNFPKGTLPKGFIDVSDYDDMQELLYATDVLITDYSSCIWDFSLTYRPSFIYARDIDTYIQKDRDFYTPINEWPYPIARNNDELVYNIENFDESDYIKKVKEHHDKLGCCETGKASDFVAERIYTECFSQKKN